MNILRQKLLNIDNCVANKYSVIFGTYNDCGNTLNIRNISSGARRIATAEYTIPLDRLGINYADISDYNSIIAAEDYILREYFILFNCYNTSKNSGSNDCWDKVAFIIYKPDQRILLRNIVVINSDSVTIRFEIILPFKNEAQKPNSNTNQYGNKVLGVSQRKLRSTGKIDNRQGLVAGKIAAKTICSNFPEMMRSFEANFDLSDMKRWVMLYKNQQYIRNFLKSNSYVSFVADGSILPRKGKSEMRAYGKDIKLFKSPDSMRISINLPDGSVKEGMGIREGVTLIVGGGYHGKSTLLSAIEHGVYNHIMGDGREYVISDESAMNICAEDGRSIKSVDISAFLDNLPTKVDTKHFSTDTASGSTSQAAAVMEALEAGCKLILIDEDRSANNFMTKDARMQKLVANDPITPYLDRVREIYERAGTSSILVIGGSGDYLDVADNVIMMDSFDVIDATITAKRICETFKNDREYTSGGHTGWLPKRYILNRSLTQYVDGKEVLEFRSGNTVLFGKELIKLDELLTCPSQGQVCAILLLLRYISIHLLSDKTNIRSLINNLYSVIKQNGIATIAHPTISYLSEYEYIRPVELASPINRLKSIRICN